VKKAGLAALMGSVTVGELKGLIALKGKIEGFDKRKRALEKDLADVNRQMDALEKAVEKVAGKGKPARMPSERKRVAGRRRKRIRQPSLSSLVLEVLEERKKPMRIADICAAVLGGKKYRTRAKDFKSQLRILLYKNEKGLFKKAGPGTFAVAAGVPKGAK
jgi:hypothetical protein